MALRSLAKAESVPSQTTTVYVGCKRAEIGVCVCAEYGCAAGAKGAAGDAARAAPDMLTYIDGADSKAAGLSPTERRAALAWPGCLFSRAAAPLLYGQCCWRRGCRAALAGVGGLRPCQGARVSLS